jgi:hypothetical protein
MERKYLERCVCAFMPWQGAETRRAVLGARVERGELPREVNAGRANEGGGEGKGRAMEDAEGLARRSARVDYEGVGRPFVGGVHHKEAALVRALFSSWYLFVVHLSRPFQYSYYIHTHIHIHIHILL